MAQTTANTCSLHSFAPVEATGFSNTHQGALENANLEYYRLKDAKREISFEDGATFILSSAMEMAAVGCEISVESHSTKDVLNRNVTVVFQLLPNQMIGVKSEISPKSKTSRLGKGFPSQNPTIIKQGDFNQMSESKQRVILSRPHQYTIE